MKTPRRSRRSDPPVEAMPSWSRADGSEPPLLRVPELVLGQVEDDCGHHWVSDGESMVAEMSNLGSRRWNGLVFLAGFLPFALLWQSIGVVWAFLVGVVLAGLVLAGQAFTRRR